jgi:protein SCO1/2
MTDKRLKRTFLIVISALCLAALIAYVQVHIETSKPQDVVAEDFGGPFTLTDHTGKTVTEKDFEGRYRLIYFGFTFCPAICPTELAKMTKALKAIGPTADDITPLFITVDPERDTADVLGKYIKMFDKRLIGLTGTPEQIKKSAKEYKIYYAKVQDPGMTEYTMDHSSFIYFIDPDNNLRAVFRAEDTAEIMAAKINETMALGLN